MRRFNNGFIARWLHEFRFSVGREASSASVAKQPSPNSAMPASRIGLGFELAKTETVEVVPVVTCFQKRTVVVSI